LVAFVSIKLYFLNLIFAPGKPCQEVTRASKGKE